MPPHGRQGVVGSELLLSCPQGFFICVPDHGVSSSVAVQVRCLPVVMVGAIFLEYGDLQGESQVFGSFRATSELMSVGLALKSRIMV